MQRLPRVCPRPHWRSRCSAQRPSARRRATCPLGKRVLGGGTELTANAAGGPIAIQDSHPLTNASGWFASAAETAAFAQSWALRVWAVCATVS